MTITMRPYQQRVITEIHQAWKDGDRVICGVLPTGCHARGSEILMYDGSVKKVENVEPGDLLMGPDSLPRVVLNLCRGRQKMYRIDPVKGDPFVVNSDHVLHLKRVRSGYKSPSDEPGITEITVSDYIAKAKHFKHIHKLKRVDVDFPFYRKPTLDPWVAGAMLGDGSLNHCTPGFTNMDPDVINKLMVVAVGTYECHMTIDVQRNGNKSYAIRISDPGQRGNRFKQELMRHELWGMKDENKYVPDIFKLGSRDTRLAVLAGLIDTDGHIDHKMTVDFVSKSEKLAADFTFIARSLGFAAYMKPVRKGCQTGAVGTYYRVCMSGDMSVLPLVRKHQLPRARMQIKDVLCTGFTVNELPEDDFYGFTLSGDHLYLDASFTVHHNSGKTRVKAHLTKTNRDADRVSVLMAHRHELIGQISLALAAEGIMHNLICSKQSLRYITTSHVEEFGRSFYSPRAENVFVSSVDSMDANDIAYFKRIGKSLTWTTDEGHHVLRENKWGKASAEFDASGAKGLIVTATPRRADGKGLGRHADGLIDKMIIGPSMRELITMGYLTDYRVFCPPSDLRLDLVETSKSTGDYQKNQLKEEVKKSRLVGDVVEQYLKIAKGKRGVTFSVDVEDAENIAQRYRDCGVPAAALSARNSPAERNKMIRDFKAGELLQIVNCDLLGEGFDLPAIEAVSFARPTQSYGLYIQQFGRALRIMEGKERALIIDHVGNVQRHNLPDAPVEWSLDRRDRRGKSDSGAESLTVCRSCFQPFEARKSVCPHCGERIKPVAEGVGRTLEEVEGDLTELSPEMLAKMRGEVDRVMESPDDVKNRFLNAGAAHIVAAGAAKNHRLRLEAQTVLRHAMTAFWDFYREQLGCDVRSAQVTFWNLFAIDVMSAQTLGKNDAEALTVRIREHLQVMGVAA